MTRIWGLKVKECVYVLKQPQESTSFITQLTVTHDFRTLIASTNIGTIEQYDVDKRLKDIRLKIDDFIRQESFFKHKPNLHDQLILMQEQYRALEDRYKDLEERHSEAQQSSEFWKEHSMQLEQGSEKSGKKMSSRNNSSLDMAFVTPNKSFGVNESVIERQTPSQSFFIQVPYKSDSSQFETPVAYESGNFGSGDKKTKSSVLSSSEREKSESNIKTSESESRKEYSE